MEKKDWEVDIRIIVPPSFYKELKKHKYNMKKYIKSKLVKLKTKEEEKEIYKCVKCGRVVEDKRLLTFSGVCTRCTVVI